MLPAQPEEKTLLILTSRLHGLRHDVAMLQKKAQQLGVEPMTLTVGKTFPFERKVPERDFYGKLTGLYRMVILDHTEVRVSGRGPVVPGGYSFLAKLEHLQEGNIVHVVPGGPPLPTRYRTAPPACEHCRTQRDRKDTFVVDEPGGRMVQVGRSCLRDYMGHPDAERLAELATDLALFFRDLERDDDGEDGGGEGLHGGGSYLRTLDILASAVDSIREFGFWKSDSLSPQPTWVDAADRLLPPKESGRRVIYPSEIAKDRAKKIIAWGAQIPFDVKSEYMSNLRVALQEEVLHHRAWSLICSAPIAYARALGEDPRYGTRETKPLSESVHFGVVGDRTRLKLTLEKSISLKSAAYGDSWIYRFRTEQGDVAVWKSGTRIDDTRPDHDLVCSIGKHDEYRGVKQTVIKRCVPFEEKRELTAEETAQKKSDAAAAKWLATVRTYKNAVGVLASNVFEPKSWDKKSTQADKARWIAMRGDGLLEEQVAGGSTAAQPVMFVRTTAKGDAELLRAVLEVLDAGPVNLPLDSGWRWKNAEEPGLLDSDRTTGADLITEKGRSLLAQLRAAQPAPAGKKRKKNPERGAYPDGRSIPIEGDRVYQYARGLAGSRATINGVVIKSKKGKLNVKIVGGGAAAGGGVVANRGKTYALDAEWTLVGDPVVEAYRNEKARTAAEESETKDREEHQGWERMRQRVARALAEGDLPLPPLDQLHVGDVLLNHFDDGPPKSVTVTAALDDEGELAVDDGSGWTSSIAADDYDHSRTVYTLPRRSNPGALPEGFSGFDVFEDETIQPSDLPLAAALRGLRAKLGEPATTDATSYFKPGKAPVDRVWIFTTKTGQGGSVHTTGFVWTDGDPKAMAKMVRAALIAPSKVPSSVVRLQDWPIVVGSPSGMFESPGTSKAAAERSA